LKNKKTGHAARFVSALSENLATFGELLASRFRILFMLAAMMSNGVTQALLLLVTRFAAQFAIIAQDNQQLVHADNCPVGNGSVDAGGNLIKM